MAVLSSLLGIGQQQPVAGPAIATTAFPAELAPYYKDILSKSQALYEDRTAEGYQPYQGPTMAEFTPEQQQAFTGIAGLAGQQAPKFAEAEQLTRQAAAPIATADIEQFMNPYQQAVVDIEKREAQKQFEQKTLPSIRAAQVAQGSFGGTRGTLLEAQTLAEQDRLLSDIQSRGSQQAFNQALQQAQAQRAREGQAGAQLATMAPQAFKAQLGELGAVQTVGEEKQRQAQTALNEAYKQFIEERQFPQQSLGQYQAVVQAQPASQMLETVQYAPPPPPLGQQLLGGLGTLVGTYGAFGGFSPGGLFGKSAKTGGGISGLPVVKRQVGGGFPGQIGYGGTGSTGLSKDIDFLKPYLSSLGKYGTMAKDAYLRTFVDPLEYGIEKGKEYLKPGSGGIFSDPDPQGSAKIRQIAGVTYPEPTEEELDVGRSPMAKDLNFLKKVVTDTYGEAIDVAELGTNELIDIINKAKIPLGKYMKKSFQPTRKFEEGDFRKAIGYPEDDISLTELANITGASDTSKGLIPYLKKLSDIEYDKRPGKDLTTKDKFNIIKDTFIKQKEKMPTIEETTEIIKRDKSKDYTKEQLDKIKEKGGAMYNRLKEKGLYDDAIVTDKGVVKQIKPEEVNEAQAQDIKGKEKQLGKKIKDLKDDPTNTQKKTSLQTARDDYLAALRKQKDDLGKQQSNIDDSRRKSMFEFLAKVSSKYGQGATLPEAAASELDSAASRTRQLDQAALDLKNKQREADLTVSKEKLSQEEKKAAAKVTADKEKREDFRKGQELYINYLKATKPDGKSLKTLTKDARKNLKKGLKAFDSFDEIKTELGGDTQISIPGVSSKNINKVLPKLFKNERFLTDLHTEMSKYKFDTDDLVDSGGVIRQSVKDLLASGNYRYDEKKGFFGFGTTGEIK